MNVIDAAFELGRELSSSFARNGGQFIDDAFLSGLFGKEISIRLRELFDYHCTKGGLFGYQHSVDNLSSLETGGSEALPLDYWIPVINASKSNEFLISAVDAMSREGTRCSALVQMALQGETYLSREEYALGVCDAYKTLCAALRRTGVFRALSKCLAELDQDGLDHLTEMVAELEKAFSQSPEHFIDHPITCNRGVGDTYTAVKNLVFLSILMEKAVYWGFENRRSIIEISQCVPVPDYSGDIHKICLTTTNPSVAVDRVFSAVAVTDGEELRFFLVPYKAEISFSDEKLETTITGISYPASDARLFEVSS